MKVNTLKVVAIWILNVAILTQSSLVKGLTKITERYPRVVIVGGGPSGLVSALAFSKLGWNNIKILEKRGKESYSWDHSYTYAIDKRGQLIFESLNLTHVLSKYGVEILNGTEFTEISAEGQISQQKIKVNNSTRIHVMRNVILDLLLSEIQSDQSTITKPKKNIEIIFNCGIQNITKGINGKIILHGKKEDRQDFTYETDVLVGCDGVHSVCRSFLEKDWNSRINTTPKPFLKRMGILKEKNPFTPVSLRSPTGGLQFKFISLNPSSGDNVMIKNYHSGISIHPIPTHHMSYIRGKDNNILYIHPINPKLKHLRTAGIIKPARDSFWRLNPAKIYSYFKQNFPKIVWEKFINEEEILQAFSKPPGRFSHPQYCSAMYSSFYPEDGRNEDPSSYAVLLGDSVHCFPPDIGQGANAALQDVFALRKSIMANPANFTAALKNYENIQLPEAKAIVKLCVFAFPYAYNQNKFRQMLFNIHFLGQLYLSKLLPFLFSPPAFHETINPKLKYSEILRNHRRSTRNFWAIFLTPFLLVLLSSFRRSILP